MRHPLPIPSKFFAGLAGLLLLLVGCQALPSGLGAPSGADGGLSVTVIPEVHADRQVMASAAPVYTGKDIDHAVVGLYRCELLEDEVATEVAVASMAVDNLNQGQSFWPSKRDITFKNLRADTYYRIRGFAYSAPGYNTADLISTEDLRSAVDFQTTNEDRPTPIGLRIRLKDRNFDGNAVVHGVQIEDGGYVANGFVTTIGGYIQASPDIPTPGTPLPPPSPDPLQDYVATPTAIAYDEGTLWFADSGNNMVRRMFNDGYGNFATMHIDQAYNTSWDTAPGFNAGDVTILNARYNNPQGLAVGPDDKLFIADTDNHCIRVRDGANDVVSVLSGEGPASPGGDDGPKGSARFQFPTGLAYDSRTGLLFVADTGNNKLRWVNVSSGEAGTIPGLPAMYEPRGLAVSGDRLFYTESHCVRSVQIRIVGGNPTYVNPQLVAGSSQGQAVGAGNVAQFNVPGAIVVDTNRNLLVADTGNHRIQHIRFSGGTVNVSVFAGGNPGRLNGYGPNAQFLQPRGLAIDPDGGLLFVADTNNHRIRKID